MSSNNDGFTVVTSKKSKKSKTAKTAKTAKAPIVGCLLRGPLGPGASPARARESRAMQRLARDLRELSEHPIVGLAAGPVSDENMFLWHANVYSTQHDATFHFTLDFGKRYPAVPPVLDLMTPLPHPNVFPGQHDKANHVCLDILEDGDFAEAGTQQYSGWSSAYSVQTLLLQLQAFLLDERHQHAVHVVTLADAIHQARSYRCPHPDCHHDAAADKIDPPLPKEEQVRIATERSGSRTLVHVPILVRQPVAQPLRARKSSANGTSNATGVSSAIDRATERGIQGEKEAEVTAAQTNEQWHTVQGKKARRNSKSKAKAKSTAKSKAKLPSSGAPSQLETVSTTPPEALSYAIPYASKQAKRERKRHLKEEAKAATLAAMTPEERAKAEKARQRHHLRRLRKKRREQAEKMLQSMDGSDTNSSTENRMSNANDAPSPPPPPLSSSSSSSSSSASAPASVPSSAASSAVSSPATSPRVPIGAGLTKLPYKVLLVHIFGFLDPEDVARSACVCKAMYAAAEEGYLWKDFFRRQYPASQLTPANMKAWRWLYQLEANKIYESLQCWHSKASFEEECLGYPCNFTVNPKRGEVDYVDVIPELLGFSAYRSDLVRRTPFTREDFVAWIPAYITQEHFERCIPLLERQVLKLNLGFGNKRGGRGGNWRRQTAEANDPQVFVPEMALNLVCKAISTYTVLLSDRGIAVSDRACHGIVGLHRLLLAVVDIYGLQSVVDARIKSFISDPRARTKAVCPRLGEFLPLLLASEKYSWPDVAPAYLRESFARSALWICRDSPDLAEIGPDAPAVDEKRLQKSLESTRISRALLCFHVFYQIEFGGNPRRSNTLVKERLDRFFGVPSRADCALFKKCVNRILSSSSWPDFFRVIGVRVPSKQALTEHLRTAVEMSLKQGYHKRGMDFSQIHRSGVSAILLKGDSYSAPPNLSRCVFEDTWGWREQDGTQFLDATVLIFERAFSGAIECSEFVDFARTRSSCGTVDHSGDVINEAKRSGRHTVEVDLKRLPKTVCALFFVLSSYTTTLRAIQQPWVRFSDPESGVELCRYSLEDQATGDNTCVLMCGMFRGGSRWSVDAVGHIGMGRASGMLFYKPVIKVARSYAEQGYACVQ